MKNDVIISSRSDENGMPQMVVTFGKWTRHVAGFVEYGHRIAQGGPLRISKRTGKVGKLTGMVPAHPFVRPAFEATVGVSTAAIQASLTAGVEKAVMSGDSDGGE